MITAQAIRFRSPLVVMPSGQVMISGPRFPGNLGLLEWNAMTSVQKVDFLRRNAVDRQQLADALTYGLEHGYNEIGPSVSLAESALNAAIAPSGQICSRCGCGMGSCGCSGGGAAVGVGFAVMPSGQAASASRCSCANNVRRPSSCDCANRGFSAASCRCSGSASRAIVPSGQAATPAAAPAPTTTAPTSRGVRPIVFVGVTGAAILGVYLFRRAQQRQFRDNPHGM